MSVIRNQIKGNFSIIENHIITDSRISDAAFRVACYLISRPDNWQINNKDIMKQLRIKQQDTLAKYWKQLLNAGVLFRREKPKVGGRFVGYDYAIGGIPDDWQTTPCSTGCGATDNSETGVLNKTEDKNTDLNNKEDDFETFHPSPDGCSQTSNEFDVVDANIDAKPQREVEKNDTSEYLKAKSAKQKASPKPKAKREQKALFANQVSRNDFPCTKAALYAIEHRVAQSGGKHNFWVDANTSRPVIQLDHIKQVERNLTDLAEYFDTMPGTIPERAASLMMEMYGVRGAAHKVKGKKTAVDLAFLACIGLKDPHSGCDYEGMDLCGWFANFSGT